MEYIRFEGARGNISHKIDFSGNPHLKTVRSGQDGVKELDFSSNIELEDLSVFLNSSFRWLDIDNCTNLRRINTQGANIPFVDLTHCHKLEKVNINYWNLYKNGMMNLVLVIQDRLFLLMRILTKKSLIPKFAKLITTLTI